MGYEQIDSITIFNLYARQTFLIPALTKYQLLDRLGLSLWNLNRFYPIGCYRLGAKPARNQSAFLHHQQGYIVKYQLRV